MILADSFSTNGSKDEGRFLAMIIISIAAHGVLLLGVSIFSGFTSTARINAVPDYTPVTIVSAGDLSGLRPKEIQIQKARKEFTSKQPTLVQERADIKKLEASKMAVEKKALSSEKIAPQKVEPTPPAGNSSPGGAETEAPVKPSGSPASDTFAVQGIGAAGTKDIPEITVYTSIVVDRIMEAWFLPPALKREALQKNLVMVIGIRIDQGGGVTLQGIEQSSGNSLFDNYALSAIKKIQSESFPPLPDVYRGSFLDLGIRFHPSEIGS